MTPAARIAAAIEAMADIEARRRPAADALKDWGLSHRFAGSKDRAAIASLVYDGLRRKASAAWLMNDPSPRAIIIGALRLERDLPPDVIAALFSGEGHAPPPLSDAEGEQLTSGSLDGAPAHIAGDCPEWIAPSLAQALRDDLVAELQALAARAPLDIRINTLKASRDQARARLSHLAPTETPHSPLGLRIVPSADGRRPALQT
ncbi:MAG TPA: MFS transporter, partial [Beijerinckiaceae bacterium]|nr:MFS transporter [Beijerinckiaceae bacterium]